GAVVCWRGEKMSAWKDKLIRAANKFDFPVHKPIKDLSNEQYQLLWTGNKFFAGIDKFFKHVESKSYKIQYRVLLSRYRGKTKCKECNGSRLRKDAEYVKVGGVSITEITRMSIEKASDFFDNLQLNKYDFAVGERILKEIQTRLKYLLDVGLSYLTLNRMSNTLSGGESQRINLATSVGSSLVGSTYILDEPSIGLHSKDTLRLIKVLRSLRDLGNTVVVVEHDEEIMMSADHIIDIGPFAGQHGGEVVFSGNHQELVDASSSLTADYLTLKKQIEVPSKRRAWKEYIEIKGARENNLKDLTVKVPLNVMTAVTGVSGSGKTTLIKSILFPALNTQLGGVNSTKTGITGDHDAISGSISTINAVEMVSQNPIGKSSRSNPVTYLKAYDEIRKLYAKQQEALINGYKPAHFSFNVKGGRCEQCEGEGLVNISMQFMADIALVCDECQGKKFKEEILSVRYQGKNIYDLLEMTIDEGVEFFQSDPKSKNNLIVTKLKTLQEVGMGYVKLGQSSSTLSGGEAQRIKLAYFLSKKDSKEKTLFIFDEPTTGLHFHDVKKLIAAINSLVERGHSVIVIEHNIDMIKVSDWVIDLGPGGGEHGGEIVFEGTPEALSKTKTATGSFLFGKC
ncbi:MAG: excinuclease ABC subunit A, partial [Granulosicoccus sp.]